MQDTGQAADQAEHEVAGASVDRQRREPISASHQTNALGAQHGRSGRSGDTPHRDGGSAGLTALLGDYGSDSDGS